MHNNCETTLTTWDQRENSNLWACGHNYGGIASRSVASPLWFLPFLPVFSWFFPSFLIFSIFFLNFFPFFLIFGKFFAVGEGTLPPAPAPPTGYATDSKQRLNLVINVAQIYEIFHDSLLLLLLCHKAVFHFMHKIRLVCNVTNIKMFWKMRAGSETKPNNLSPLLLQLNQ